MPCWNPMLLKERGLVPCGKCLPCLKRKQNDWLFRLTKENETSVSSYFITLTYNDSNVPHIGDVNVLCRRDFQLFFKRFRKRLSPLKVRYFCCGEYGSKTLRPHYHAILFFHSKVDSLAIAKLVTDSWTLGFSNVKCVNQNHFSYVAKYCTSNSDLPEILRSKDYRPFLLCSRRPAIGSAFLTTDMVNYHRQGLSTVVRLRNSPITYAMPKYYRDRIFDDDMKAQLHDKSLEYFANSVPIYANAAAELQASRYIDMQRDDATRRLKQQLYKSQKI